MEPLTTAAVAVGSIFATKIVEKAGEKIGETLVNKSSNFLASLKENSPGTITVIEKSLEEPIGSIDYGQAVLEVESAAKPNPEVAQAAQELVAAAKDDPKVASKVQQLETNINSQPANVVNNTKLAEVIKNVFQGNTIINGNF